MNTKRSKESKTKKRFTVRSPSHVVRSIFGSLKRKNAHKSVSFWLTNVLTLFLILKMYQFSSFIKHTALIIPREQVHTQLPVYDTKALMKMKPEVLLEYMDTLEKKKMERKKAKELKH